MPKKSNYNLSFRLASAGLIALHLVTFGPAKDALAFNASSNSYKLSSGTAGQSGASRSANSYKLGLDSIAEPCVGKTQSENFILNSGIVPTILSNPPVLNQNIPYQTWAINSTKDNAFDLDDYFASPEGYSLTFTVSGNSKIKVNIDPNTHMVSFSQPADWSGVEKIIFLAADTENNISQSDGVVLQVTSAVGQPNQPVIVSAELSPQVIKEGDLILLIIKAIDPDNQELVFNYSDFFSETKRWKEGDYWYSQSIWQTTAGSTGHYSVRATVSDGALTDTSSVTVNVGNLNHPPVLDSIPDITVNEEDLAVINPHATDSDNDPIVFYYSAPFDTQGKWLTTYNDSGTYNITVTASDGIDTVSQTAKVIVNNINQPPQINLTLSKYTVAPNEVIDVNLTASDPDGENVVFSLKKDGTEIASGNIGSGFITTVSFSDVGDHSLAATVTDPGGLYTTQTNGIDVAEPNSSVNPVMGDFNGDALSDLGLHNADSGEWEVCLSDHGVFRNAVKWLSGFGNSRDWLPMGGDFNGDAKTDAAAYNYTTGELKVALSSGSGFSDSGTWITIPSASYQKRVCHSYEVCTKSFWSKKCQTYEICQDVTVYPWQPFAGNFNADKYTDFAVYNKETGEVKVALGTGSGFGELTIWLSDFGKDYTVMSGDFNADGLSDLCFFNKSSGEFKVAFSNSKAFVDGSTWLTGFANSKDALVSDFNNDGLTDVGYWDKANGKWFYAISTGNKFVNKGEWLSGFGSSSDDSASTGDFNGDGITDAATFNRGQIGINRWTVKLSENKPADLLNQIDNGIGGKTQVIYAPASSFDNNLALPFPVYVTSSVSLINTFPADRSASYTQNSSFTGGYFDAAEREFRGFSKVSVTDPITNNYSETYFYQGRPGEDGALKGQIQKIISYDGNSRKISQAINTYEVKKSGPADKFLGFPAMVEQATTVWEENATYLATKNRITYDNIGNPTEQASDGDLAKTGDEKSASTIYAQAYEIGFNRPLETILKDKDGKVVSKKDFEYDSRGNLIKDTVWLNTQDIQPYTQYAYDSFGNLTSTTNALGSVVTTEYETTFYAYPQRVINSLGHSISYVYDPKFGAVKSVTDANGATSTTTYDSLGRVLEVRNALSQVTTTYTYPDFNTKTTTNALGLFKTEYIDGIGRKYKTVSSAEDGNVSRLVSSEAYYNNRGLTEKESLAHYIDEDPAQIAYTCYEYDIRGRVKKTIVDFPGSSADAQSSINYINPLYTETTDPRGVRNGVLKDIYGNVAEITEFTSGGVFKTKYEYDIQGNLTKTIDNQGNISQIFYDSLGRKVKMIDPDMGTWTYAYDLVGNLRKQTDAKGQIIEFDYDQLNRLVNKTVIVSPAQQGEAILAQYIYDDVSKSYCNGRLSKVTDQSGSSEFFYDKLGREIKSTKTVILSPQGEESQSFTVERTYDILDRLATLKYPDGETVNYTYDANSGQLESLRGTNGAEAISYVKDITYNAKGQIKVTQYGNNTQTNYTYGQDLRLSRINTSLRAAVGGEAISTLQDLNYLFDKNGNLTTLTDNLRNNVRGYTYDDLNRLARAENSPSPSGGYTNFDFQYDSIGNMTYKSDVGVMKYGASAGPHALTSAGGYNYQYDANGNMVVGKNKTLVYDTENRLTSVTQSGVVTTFAYDGDGGRVKKTVGSDPTTYIGSLFEKDSSGKITKYIFAGSNRVASVTTNTVIPAQAGIYYYHSDHLGSSNVITDKDGNLTQYCEYTPYGGLARNEGVDVAKHKFTGKELDNTGLYFYGARYYDPEIGRFITADTIVQDPFNPQTFNRYSYCGNNPINYVDPSGHWWFIIALIIKFALAHPVIFGAIAGAVFNTAMNASNIHNFGDFMGYAVIGAVAGAAGGGVGAAIGATSPFWGTVAGAFTGGFVSGAGNAGFQGASFGDAMLSGLTTGGIAAATAAVAYGAATAIEKAISSVQKSGAVRAESVGVKTPVGEQNNGTPIRALKPDVGSVDKVNNKATFWDNKTEVYGANDMVTAKTSVSAIKIGTESSYSKGYVEFDKLSLSGKMGFKGIAVEGKLNVVDINSEWTIGKFAGMEFSVNTQAGLGASAKASLIMDKNGGQAGLGGGLGPNASVEIRWRQASE